MTMRTLRQQPMAIRRTGLVTSVGLDAPSSCAAIRSKLTNPVETKFRDHTGRWIMGHEVPLEESWRGLGKLARMAAMAIDECLGDITVDACTDIPLLLCVAEPERPGRLAGLDDRLFGDIERLLARRFAASSAVVPHGRTSIAVALSNARRLLAQLDCPHVVIAAADTLLNGATLQAYASAQRLLCEHHPDGFMPGEAGGALLLTRGSTLPELQCEGIGFGIEPAPLLSDQPLRAEGLSLAIRQALEDAGCALHEADFRITDLSGEQYYFKEAALALSRTMRELKEEFDVWHPAECLGETGAAAGLAMLSMADSACRRGFAPGPRILAHCGSDAGARAALMLRFGAAT